MSRSRLTARLVLVIVPLLAGAASAAPASAPAGGMSFFCGLFQAVKFGSLVAGRPDGVLLGAIGGGIACGMGW